MKQKRVVFIGIGFLVLVLIGLYIFFTARTLRKPLAAFYRLNEQQISAVQSMLGDTFIYTTYTNETSLYAQTKSGRQPDIIFTTSGKPLELAESLSGAKNVFSVSALEGMTTSMQQSVPNRTAGNIISLPLLTDHFEIDIDTTMLRKTNTPRIATWEDIESYAAEAKKVSDNARIIFAGKDGGVLLDLLGALTEALNGKKTYDVAVQIMQSALERASQESAPLNMDALSRALIEEGDAPFYDAVQMMRRWIKSGILNPDSFSMDKRAVQDFMEAKMASVVFMTLSDHRTIPHAIIEPYASIYVPSDFAATSRYFTAPVVFGVSFTKNKKARIALEDLTDVEQQETLSRASGLAPVLAQCRIPDHQADDVRFWIAATNPPAAGLSRETTLSDSALDSLAAALAAQIRAR